MSEFPQYFGGSTTRRRYPPTPNHNEATEENIDKTLVESSTKPVENSVNPSENYSAYLLSATQIWNAAQNSIQTFADQYNNSLIVPQNQQHFTTFSAGDNSESEEVLNPTLPIEMPFRDRTAEFRAIMKSSQVRQQPSAKVANDRENIYRASIQFNQLARRVGRDLSMTCEKMEKLTQLVKKKSLFDDRDREIEEISQIIKQDITGLNNQIINLSQAKQQVSNNDKQNQDHSKLIVVGLQSKLVTISKAFQNALEIRTENLKLKRNRREKFGKSLAVPTTMPSSGNKSILLQNDVSNYHGSSSVALDMNHLEQFRQQEQVLLMDEGDYHQSRFNAMENIESSISELGTIFRQLASLVSEQGEVITRIDSNVEDTSMNIEGAHHELLKYFNNISKNRWLIIKVFGVLMAFFVFFVIFLT